MTTATKIVRGLFILACVLMGALWCYYLVTESNEHMLKDRIVTVDGKPTRTGANFPLFQRDVLLWVSIGALVGGSVAVGISYGMSLITQDLFDRFFPALVSVILAMTMGYLFSVYVLSWMPGLDQTIRVFVTTTLVLVMGYAGISLSLSRATRWDTLIEAVSRTKFDGKNAKIVDTSVIIDGRIADVCKTGFIEGHLLVPRFVLHELQSIADSADALRRSRGRRGLDILKAMQQPDSNTHVELIEDDPQNVSEVDAKLVALARKYNAKVLTNDLNLNKVAQIEGVEVLNLNDLANALKPAVLPDEQMQVRIVKEGKESQQGVGYLDDGTMVVVDGGKAFVGKDVAVLVTSVLQTSAGRMIFTKLQGVLT